MTQEKAYFAFLFQRCRWMREAIRNKRMETTQGNDPSDAFGASPVPKQIILPLSDLLMAIEDGKRKVDVSGIRLDEVKAFWKSINTDGRVLGLLVTKKFTAHVKQCFVDNNCSLHWLRVVINCLSNTMTLSEDLCRSVPDFFPTIANLFGRTKSGQVRQMLLILVGNFVLGAPEDIWKRKCQRDLADFAQTALVLVNSELNPVNKKLLEESLLYFYSIYLPKMDMLGPFSESKSAFSFVFGALGQLKRRQVLALRDALAAASVGVGAYGQNVRFQQSYLSSGAHTHLLHMLSEKNSDCRALIANFLGYVFRKCNGVRWVSSKGHRVPSFPRSGGGTGCPRQGCSPTADRAAGNTRM